MELFQYVKELDKLDNAADKTTDNMEKELIKQYKKSLKEIFLVLSETYRKYENDEGSLTYEELNRARRYEFLLGEINNELGVLASFKSSFIPKNLMSIYEAMYKDSAIGIEALAAQSLGLSYVDPLAVQASINNNISGITLNERLAKHSEDLIYAIKQDITQGLILGRTYKEMSSVIQKRLEGDAIKATRIARTESFRVRNEARLSLYSKAEEKGIVMRKMWNAARDDRTRKTHRALDGVMKNMNEYFETKGGAKALAPHGFGIAEEDVNCRCRIIAVPVDHVLPERGKTWADVDQDWREKWLKKNAAFN